MDVLESICRRWVNFKTSSSRLLAVLGRWFYLGLLGCLSFCENWGFFVQESHTDRSTSYPSATKEMVDFWIQILQFDGWQFWVNFGPFEMFELMWEPRILCSRIAYHQWYYHSATKDMVDFLKQIPQFDGLQFWARGANFTHSGVVDFGHFGIFEVLWELRISCSRIAYQ